MTASRPPRVGPAALAWALCGVTVAVALGGLILAIADPNTAGPAHASPSGPTVHDTPAGDYVPYAALTAIVFSTFAVVSAVVAARRPRNPVGWLIGAGSFLWALAVLANNVYWHIAFGRPDPPAAGDYLAWLGNWTFLPAFLLLLGLVPLLFPTGAPPGPGWRKVGWIAAVAGGVAAVSNALAPGPMDSADFAWIDNPFGIGGLGLGLVADVSFALVGAAALAGIASLVVRYRRAHGIERLQLRWVAGAGCLLVLFTIGGDVASAWLGSGAGWAGTLLGLLCVAVAVAVSLLRYRLYDIDVVINRTLVYGALDRDARRDLPGERPVPAGRAGWSHRRLGPGRRGIDAGRRRRVPPGTSAHPTGRRSPLLPAQVRRTADARGVLVAPARRGRSASTELGAECRCPRDARAGAPVALASGT